MTHDEMIEIAVRLSGRPNRKNKQGYGASGWLARQLDVDYSTVARWGINSPIPEWAERAIEKLKHTYVDKSKELEPPMNLDIFG
jgi:hypothetical protein